MLDPMFVRGVQIEVADESEILFPGLMPGDIELGKLDSVCIQEKWRSRDGVAVILRIKLKNGRTAIIQAPAAAFLSLAEQIRIAKTRFEKG